jgi:hypothetical protein
VEKKSKRFGLTWEILNDQKLFDDYLKELKIQVKRRFSNTCNTYITQTNMEKKKVVKIVKHFEDGTSEYIDGEALDNYHTNMDVANGICLSRSYITFKPVDWKVTEGNTTLDDFKHSTED